MKGLFSIYRHSSIQNQSSSVNPRIINRCVHLARAQPVRLDYSDFEPPWLRLTSEQPGIPSRNVDVTRRPLAFGRLALPKLRRELHDKDPFVVKSALLSLCDLVHDPERGFEAISLSIPERVADKLLDPLPTIRDAAALMLSTLAQLAVGREAIINDDSLVENLLLCLGDESISVRLKIAACFEMVARSWAAADVLVNFGLVNSLLEIIEKGEVLEIVEFHLLTLKSLMYDCGKCLAMKENGFRIFMNYLNHNSPSLLQKSLDCLSILTSTRYGKKLAIEKKLMKPLVRLLHYGDTEICTKAASVLMFCTIKTRAKFLAAQYKFLPKRLIDLMTNPVNANLQMFCLKVLTNICEHPDTRKNVRENYLKQLTDLIVDGSNLEHKNTLLKIVVWTPKTMQ